MLKSHEVEALRRSQAMAPLGQHQVHQLLDSCAEMAREREAIHQILSTLPVTLTRFGGHPILGKTPEEGGPGGSSNEVSGGVPA
jgi:hypothetical protein